MSFRPVVLALLCALACLSACHKVAHRLAEAETLLQEGLELRKQKQTDAAAERFSKALLLLNQCDDHAPEVRYLKGQLKDNLGVMYWKNGLSDESLSLHIEAIDLLEQNSDSISLSIALRNAARVSASLDRMADADGYYNQSLQIAKQLGDSALVNETYLEMAHDLYLNGGNFERAISTANEALRHGCDTCFCHLVIGMANYYLHQDTDARSHFDEAVKSGKPSVRMAAYQGLYLLCEAAGDYKNAYSFKTLYHDNMMLSDQEYKTKELMRIKADYELRLQKAAIESSQRQKNLFLYLILTLLILLLLFTLLLLRQRTLRAQLKAEETKNHLEAALKKNKVYITALALSEQITASTLDFNLEEADWTDYIELVDMVHDGFTRRLQRQYPLLNQGDLPMCCLTKQGFSNQVISILLNMQIASYARRKSRVKQEKMNGLNDPRPFEEMIHSL